MRWGVFTGRQQIRETKIPLVEQKQSGQVSPHCMKFEILLQYLQH